MDKDHSYRVPGGRVGVLLLHGLCGTPTEMRFVANGLARIGCTVHCPQLAGFRSPLGGLNAGFTGVSSELPRSWASGDDMLVLLDTVAAVDACRWLGAYA